MNESTHRGKKKETERECICKEMGGACVFTWTNGSEGMRETVLRLEEGRFLNLIGPRQPMRRRWLTKKGGWRSQEGGAPSLFFSASIRPERLSSSDGTQGANPQPAGNPNALTPVRFPRFPKLRTSIYVSLYQSGSLFFFLYKHLIDSLSLSIGSTPPFLHLRLFALSIYLSSKKREREKS